MMSQGQDSVITRRTTLYVGEIGVAGLDNKV
jgi:hypothetical protein